MILAFIIFVVLVIGITFYNICEAVGNKKKKPIVINGILYGFLAFLLIFNAVSQDRVSSDGLDYTIYSSGLFGNAEYQKTEGEYYIFINSSFMSSDSIAVPKENIDLPLFTKIYKPVHIYCTKDQTFGDRQITLDGVEYLLGDNVVDVKTDFFPLTLYLGLVNIAVLTAFNVIMLILNLCKKPEEK